MLEDRKIIMHAFECTIAHISGFKEVRLDYFSFGIPAQDNNRNLFGSGQGIYDLDVSCNISGNLAHLHYPK